MAYALAEEFLWKEVKGRVVVLHFDTGKYYSLNSTGSLIWKGLMDQLSSDAIVEKVCGQFDIDRHIAEKDTQELISEFLTKQFIIPT